MVIKNFEGYEIRSVHEQKYASRWGALKDNQYRIFIKNLATGIECSFPYWNGTMIYCPMKESRELIFAVSCFCSDAVAVIDAQFSFENFCNEFGYDIYDDYCGYNRKSKAIYKACCRTHKYAIHIFGSEEELYRVANECVNVENGDYENEIA